MSARRQTQGRRDRHHVLQIFRDFAAGGGERVQFGGGALARASRSVRRHGPSAFAPARGGRPPWRHGLAKARARPRRKHIPCRRRSRRRTAPLPSPRRRQRLQIFMRIAADDAVAADMRDNALADAGKRQLPRQSQRHRAAAHNHARDAPCLAKARRDRAEQSAPRHENAERVRTDEPASCRAGACGGGQRVVHRHIFGRRHDGRDSAPARTRRWRRARLRPAYRSARCSAVPADRRSGHRAANRPSPAAAPKRDAADKRRAGCDHAGDLVARIASGRADHGDPPRLGIKERQAQLARTCDKSPKGNVRRTARGKRLPLCVLPRYDGKALLRRHGLAVPRGVLLRAGEAPPDDAPPGPGFFSRPRFSKAAAARAAWCAACNGARRIPRRAAADPRHPRRCRHAAPARRGGADRARDFHRGPRRRHAAAARTAASRPRRRERRAVGRSLRAFASRDAAPPDAGNIFPRSPNCFPATLPRGWPVTPRDCRTSPARRTCNFSKSIRWRSPTDGRLIACDAKIIRDDSADFRHEPSEFALSRTLAERAMTALERSRPRPWLSTGRDRRQRRPGHLRRRPCHDDDGPLGRSRAAAASFMDNLRGAPDETMTERLKIARALAARPQHQGDRVPDRDRVAFARRADRRAHRLDRRRATAEAALRRACRRPRRDAQMSVEAAIEQAARAGRRPPSPTRSRW